MQDRRRKARGEGQTFNLNATVRLLAEGMVGTMEKAHPTEGALTQWQQMSLCHMPEPKASRSDFPREAYSFVSLEGCQQAVQSTWPLKVFRLSFL